jgi:hypothetical protein
MLRILTRAMGGRAGLVLALAYFACVVAPPVALAFADACLTDDHHVAAAAHVHANGSAHHQEPQASDRTRADSEGKSVPGHCCGVTCLNAIADQPSVSIGVTTFMSVLQPALEVARGGLGPYRLDRPPDVLLSL